MITLSQLTALLGCAALINLAYLILATIIIVLMRAKIFAIHSKLFKLDERELGVKYFDFLSTYKIMTFVFVVAPYIALKLMGH